MEKVSKRIDTYVIMIELIKKDLKKEESSDAGKKKLQRNTKASKVQNQF